MAKKKAKRSTKAPSYVKARVERFALDDLEPAPYNPRSITDVAFSGLVSSLQQFGVLAPPVVNLRDDSTLRLVGGHQRVRALKEAGESFVDCLVVEFDDEKELIANHALNNAAIEGTFIPEMTRALLDQIRETIPDSAKLFERLRFDSLLKTVLKSITATKGVDDHVDEGHVNDDELPSLGKTKANSTPGVVYRCGEHRLYCGKLVEASDLSVFDSDAADMAFSRLTANEPFVEEFLDANLGHLIANTSGAVYVATDSDRLTQVHRAFLALGGYWSNTILAYAPQLKPSKGEVFRPVVLPILYGWREAGMRLFFGDRSQSNVFYLKNSPPRSDLPVEAAVRHIVRSSKKGGTVLDVQASKGATVIAAEKTSRRLLGYVSTPSEMDRVRRRWTRFVKGAKADWRKATNAE